MAFIGFVAKLGDGREIRECDATWDGVPDGIASISLQRDWQETIATMEGAPGRKFFFYNEAAAIRGGMGVLAGKGFGYIEGDTVREFRMAASDESVRECLRVGAAPALDLRGEIVYPLSEFRFGTAALRDAA